MTIVHRNKADSEKQSSASGLRNVPNIIIPAPIAIQNSFSTLEDDTNPSDSDSGLDQFDWKTDSEQNTSDGTNDSTNDSNSSSSTEESSSSSSEDELTINDKQYRRVRQPWCKDGIPCVVTSVITLLAFAYFMQFVFYMCGLVNDECFSPASLLQYSKGKR